MTVVSVLMHGKTVQCDDSAEIGSVHDEEQGSENRPLRNAIQVKHRACYTRLSVRDNQVRTNNAMESFHTTNEHMLFVYSLFLFRIFMSRIFHPDCLVPIFHVLHYHELHFRRCRFLMSRIFSPPDQTTGIVRDRHIVID